MTRGGVLAVGLAATVLVSSRCAAESVLEKGEKDYRKGWVTDAEVVMQPLVEKKDKDYPRYLLSLGSVELSLGDYWRAGQYFTAAVQNLSVELGSFATGVALFRAEKNRPYRGYPHEKVLAHTYLGLAYFQQNKYNDARIEFAKAREEERGTTEAQRSDFATSEFLDGVNALRAGRFNDAQVSFRKITELKKDWPLGWFSLCRASYLNHDDGEAAEAWARYESLSDSASRLARDGSTPCALFLIATGWGPTREADSLGLCRWERTPSAEKDVRLAVAGQPRLDAVAVDDLYNEASTSGGVVGQVARKLVSLPLRALFASAKSDSTKSDKLDLKSDADVRSWDISPGTIHLAALPIPPSPSTVEITCFDDKGRAIDADRRALRFIGGQPFDRSPIIYVRVLPNAGERAVTHDRKH